MSGIIDSLIATYGTWRAELGGAPRRTDHYERGAEMTEIVKSAIASLNHATAIKASIRALTDDEDAINDTLEGETDLEAIIRGLVLSLQDDEVLVVGLEDRRDAIRERLTRFKDRVAAKRALIQQAMELIGKTRIELDVATVALGKPAPALQVLNEAEIPARFWHPGDPVLDRKALLAALKEHQDVPGVALKNAAPQLSIRGR